MVGQRYRFLKSAFGFLVGLFLLSHEIAFCRAEPPGGLRFERTLRWNQKVCGSFFFAPDGKTVAGYSLDWFGHPSEPSLLRLWAVDSGMNVVDLNVPGDNIMSIAFGQDGHTLFSAAWGGTVRVHDLRTLKTEVIPDLVGQELVISPDRRQLACVASKSVWVVDLASRKITATKTLQNHRNADACLPQFSPDGKVLAIARYDSLRVNVFHEVEICDVRSLSSISLIRDKAPEVTSLSYSPDGSVLFIGDDGGGVCSGTRPR